MIPLLVFAQDMEEKRGMNVDCANSGGKGFVFLWSSIQGKIWIWMRFEVKESQEEHGQDQFWNFQLIIIRGAWGEMAGWAEIQVKLVLKSLFLCLFLRDME